MPTYDYRCSVCGHEESVIQTISQYIREPKRPCCVHGGEICVMERKLSVNPAMSGLANALAGDRHYDGLRATDGTPIDTRSKHRAYMKANGLAMADDFKQTWADAAKEREKIRSGAAIEDAKRKELIREQVTRAVAQPD
jgi:putative FmdB family regulatory protein